MTHWLKIALRNIMKNRRRSFITLTAIAIGFAAVCLFQGYTARIYEELRESAIRVEGLGHLTIFKDGWLENGHTDPSRYMFTREEYRKVIAIAENDNHVVLATPQLHVSGLVTNGTASYIFLAKGVVPLDYLSILGAMANMMALKGEQLSAKTPYGVLMAERLAEMLDFEPGSDGVIMGATLDGQMNAMDIAVQGLYDTGSDATNDKFLLLPFEHAQGLYDTEQADRVIVLLDDWRHVDSVLNALSKKFRQENLPTQIKTWNELSLYHSKVRNMFDIIIFFMSTIVFIIVVMSTVNTMGMAVMERTREIGTLRALGLTRSGVSFLFALEGMLLGLFGSLIGAVINVGVWWIVRYSAPTYTPPGISNPVPLLISLVPSAMFKTLLLLIVISLVAAIIPAQRAARQRVVEALSTI